MGLVYRQEKFSRNDAQRATLEKPNVETVNFAPIKAGVNLKLKLNTYKRRFAICPPTDKRRCRKGLSTNKFRLEGFISNFILKFESKEI